MRHVLRLPQQVPWTGQPGRTTGLERLGFYGDTWAALRAGLRAALRAGLRAALRTGPPGHATRRAAGQCYAPGRGPRRTPDQLQRLRAAGPSDQRTDDADTYQWTSRTRAPGVYSRIHVPYAGTTLGGRTRPCWSLLHTAGQDNSGRVIRLHLLGPAAILGSGPEQGREEQRGPTRGGTGGRRRLRRAEPGRAGP